MNNKEKNKKKINKNNEISPILEERTTLNFKRHIN